MGADVDQSLVDRARGGDRRAFDALVRRHRDRVFALAYGVVRNEQDAADITQETFITVIRRLQTFDGRSQFSTWLHRVAINRAYDHLRRRVPEPVDPAYHDAVAAGSAAQPTNQQDQYLACRDLLNAISELDEVFRGAVLLVDVLGATVDEAAESLGVQRGTVKSRLFRGRAALAAHLGTLGYSGASNEQ